MRDLGALAFLVVIPIAWTCLSLLMSRLSGWSLLAKHFRAHQTLQGERARMRTGRLGVIQYHSSLNFCITDEGLGISVAFPLRLGHPPLMIPWSEIHGAAADTMLYSHKVKLSIGRPTLVRATLPGWVRYRLPIEMRR